MGLQAWRSVYNTLLLNCNVAREIVVSTLGRPSLLLSYGLFQALQLLYGL